MTYPWPLSTTADVEIDADEIADYVESNREWFIEKLQGLSPEREVLKKLNNIIADILNEHDQVRVLRDSTHDSDTKPAVILYNKLVELKNIVESEL